MINFRQNFAWDCRKSLEILDLFIEMMSTHSLIDPFSHPFSHLSSVFQNGIENPIVFSVKNVLQSIFRPEEKPLLRIFLINFRQCGQVPCRNSK